MQSWYWASQHLFFTRETADFIQLLIVIFLLNTSILQFFLHLWNLHCEFCWLPKQIFCKENYYSFNPGHYGLFDCHRFLEIAQGDWSIQISITLLK